MGPEDNVYACSCGIYARVHAHLPRDPYGGICDQKMDQAADHMAYHLVRVLNIFLTWFVPILKFYGWWVTKPGNKTKRSPNPGLEKV